MCGIAGFFQNHEEENKNLFKPEILKYLLIKQDERGKDNCGIVFTTTNKDNKRIIKTIVGSNDRIEKESRGTDTSTFWLMLQDHHAELDNFSFPVMALGHSRRVSVGGTKRSNAQPVVVKMDDDILFGVHNGTISNIREICLKFDVPYSNTESDSVMFFKALAKNLDCMPDVLASYEGAAAFVWTLKSDLSTVYCWTGKEKESVYFSSVKKDEQERPLHYLKTKAGIYISSEVGPLNHAYLFHTPGVCLELPEAFEMDTITVIKKGVIDELIKVKRNVTKKPAGNPHNYAGRYSCDIDCDDDWRYSQKTPVVIKQEDKEEDRGVPKWEKSTYFPNLNYGNHPTIKIVDETFKNGEQFQEYWRKSKLYIKDGLYWINEILMHTILAKDTDQNGNLVGNWVSRNTLIIDEDGCLCTVAADSDPSGSYKRVHDGKRLTINEVKFLYFFRGHLLKSRACREELANVSMRTVVLSNDLKGKTEQPIVAKAVGSYGNAHTYSSELGNHAALTTIYKYPYTCFHGIVYHNTYKGTVWDHEVEYYKLLEPKHYALLKDCDKCKRLVNKQLAINCVTCVSGDFSASSEVYKKVLHDATLQRCINCYTNENVNYDTQFCKECEEVNGFISPTNGDKVRVHHLDTGSFLETDKYLETVKDEIYEKTKV
jgi:hypothetical protein